MKIEDLQIPNLIIILVMRVPAPHLIHHSTVPHIHFPSYTRAETLSIVSRAPLSLQHVSVPSLSDDEGHHSTNDEDSTWLWTHFTAAVWDSLGQSYARDLVSFRSICTKLWPPFVQPILDGHYGAREFSKLMVKNRGLFQSEAALIGSIVPQPTATGDVAKPKKGEILSLLSPCQVLYH